MRFYFPLIIKAIKHEVVFLQNGIPTIFQYVEHVFHNKNS